MTFKSQIWHPNVYEDGKVCISILHPPGEDRFNELVSKALILTIYLYYSLLTLPDISVSLMMLMLMTRNQPKNGGDQY